LIHFYKRFNIKYFSDTTQKGNLSNKTNLCLSVCECFASQKRMDSLISSPHQTNHHPEGVELNNNNREEVGQEEEEEIPTWLYEEDDPRNYFMPVNELKYTDSVTVRRVYCLARKVSSLFTKLGLFYWTTGGTTLGIVRHGGLIPWDDDLDVCILQEDVSKLLSASHVFQEAGIHIQESQPYAFKIFDLTDSDQVKNLHYTHRYPFCDVFVMVKEKGDQYALCDKTGRNAWPNEVYSQAQLDGVSSRRFGNTYLQCPGSPELYLTNTYGETWDRRGATHFFNHANAGFLRSVQFEMEQDMFMPALPFQ
jgi:lipopolysaccharide cholinephosphotransferase